MRNIIIPALLVLMAMTAVGAAAQSRNRLTIPDLEAQIGDIRIPVNVDNTDEVVAMQFDLSVSEGLSIGSTATLTDRSDGHVVTVRQLDDGTYRYIVHSASNRPLRGQQGTVLYIAANVPDGVAEGTNYDLTITRAVLSKASGENILTEARGGSISVARLPDLAVTSVGCDAQTLVPGQSVVVSWEVANKGRLATADGWSEQLSLVSEDGTQSKLIATTYYDEALDAGGIVSRQAEVAIPEILGMDGKAFVQVKLQTGPETGESAATLANNTNQSETAVDVGKLLFLKIQKGRVEEADNPRISFTLSRSGNWRDDQSFDITANSSDSRVSYPSAGIIPAGSLGTVFYVEVADNDILDADSVVTFTVGSHDYSDVSCALIIEDDEHPDIRLTLSESVIQEGDSLLLTVSVDNPVKQELAVAISCEYPARFSYPAHLVIPAGETSVSAMVRTQDDDTPDLETSCMFTAIASGYNKSEALVILEDNDMPDIKLELTPRVISEGAGPQSVVGVIRRTSNIDKRVVVKIQDNAPAGTFFYTKNSIEMPAGAEKVEFTMGPVDNSIVDGERSYVITAATYVKSCSCVVGQATGTLGSVQDTLTILDDDGPALGLTPSATVVKEGQSLSLTVSRNTQDVTQELTVNLSSNYDDNLSYNHQAVIPAGSQSVEVTIVTLRNDTPDDNFNVSFIAQADSFIRATCWFMVTDQSLPDAVVSEVALASDSVYVNDVGDIAVTVDNIGYSAYSAPLKVMVFTDLSSEPVATLYSNEDLPVGEHRTLSGSFMVPSQVVSTSLYAVVNGQYERQELLTTNNRSQSVNLDILAPFYATVEPAKAVYEPGAEIAIRGSIIPRNDRITVSRQDVEVYVLYSGIRQTMKAMSDDNGRFEVVYTPLEGQTGHFEIGACYPGEQLDTVMAVFDIYGIRLASYAPIKAETTVGTPYQLNIGLVNPCSNALTGILASVTQAPANCSVHVDVPSIVEADSSIVLKATVTGTSPSPALKWDMIYIHVETAEGAQTDIPVYYYCAPEAPSLSVVGGQKASITLPEGYETEYQLTITNQGRGETGVVTISPPEGAEWLTLVTPRNIPSLAQNDSAIIVLRLTTEGLQLNIDAFATIGINCENGDGTLFRLDVMPVSTVMGKLHVRVGDEYTYNTVEAPFVEGALVTLRHPSSKEIVAQGTTGVDGVFDTEIKAGYYNMTVECERHDTYASSVYIRAGRTNNEDIFLSYQAVTFDFDVERTEVEDLYHVEITGDYEVNVPAPVVVWAFPGDIPLNDTIFYVSCTNKGKLPAFNLQLELPEPDEFFTFEPLGATQYERLNPEAALVFPLLAKYTGPAPNPGGSGSSTGGGTGTGGDTGGTGGEGGTGPGGGSDIGGGDNPGGDNPGDNPGGDTPGSYPSSFCKRWQETIRSSYQVIVCKDGKNDTITKWTEGTYPFQIGNCPSTGGGGGGVRMSSGGRGSGGIGGLNGGGGSWVLGGSGGGSATTPVRNCNPCVPNILHRLIECGGQWIPYYECAKDAYMAWEGDGSYLKTLWCIIKETIPGMNCFGDGAECAGKSALQTSDYMDDCLDALMGSCLGNDNIPSDKLKKVAPIINWIWKGKKCWDALTEPCGSKIDGKDWYKSRTKRAGESNDSTSHGAVTPSFITAFYNNTIPLMNAANAVHTMFVDRYGDEEWTQSPIDQIKALYYAEKEQPADANIEQLHAALDQYRPENITRSLFDKYVERVVNTHLYEAGQMTFSDNRIHHHDLWVQCFDTIAYAHEFALANGFQNAGRQYEYECNVLMEKVNESSNAICATITLKLEQEIAMTREAFRGTLTVTNGNETTAMTDVRLNLQLKDNKGNIATQREFQVNAESLEGFAGELDLLSGWTLSAGQKGVATILFIPTKYAAPTEPVVYEFGGSLSYIDPFTQLEVTRQLNPVTMTVNPTPVLDLTYFMQRDMISDDPLTCDVEPTEEAEFALLINNSGFGDANNVRIVTAQPEIIRNDREVKIRFDIVSSQINGQQKNLALNSPVNNDFGTIPAHSQAYAQWWMTTDMLGHFVAYNVEATHVTSYGNPDLSLLGDVSIHELIRGFTARNDSVGNPVRGFLVNEIPDAYDLPDTLFFTDATQQRVYQAMKATMEQRSELEYVLTVESGGKGWNYASLADPTRGRQELLSVTRLSDGSVLPLDNIWQTDRTLRDGKEPLYENRLHFVGLIGGPTEESYLLTFAQRPDVELDVESFAGLPDEGDILFSQLASLTVKFNKDVDPQTFTTDDISLGCQGVGMDVSQIKITKVSNREFILDFNGLTVDNGYYLLTVQTVGITDAEGYHGSVGRQASWIQYIDGKVALRLKASPAEGGTLTPSSGHFDYGQTVSLNAQPAEGYDFVKWLDGQVEISDNPQFDYLVEGDAELTALFYPKRYYVSFNWDSAKGTVENGITGFYNHDTRLQLKAIPAEGYVFDTWVVDDKNNPGNSSLLLIVNRSMDVTALFKVISEQGINAAFSDALRVSVGPLPLRDWMRIDGNFGEVRALEMRDMRGLRCLHHGRMEAGQSVSVAMLPSGLYVVTVVTDRGVYRAKVLKR